MKAFYEMIAPYRRKFAGYLTTSGGEMPLKGSWSSIVSVAPDYSEGFIAVYRNGAESSDFEFELPFGREVKKIFGGGSATVEGNKLKAILPELYSCALYRF